MDEPMSVEAVLELTSVSKSSSDSCCFSKSYSFSDSPGGVLDGGAVGCVVGRASISMGASTQTELDDRVVANPMVDVLKEDDSWLSPANGFTPDCEESCEAGRPDRVRSAWEGWDSTDAGGVAEKSPVYGS